MGAAAVEGGRVDHAHALTAAQSQLDSLRDSVSPNRPPLLICMHIMYICIYIYM